MILRFAALPFCMSLLGFLVVASAFAQEKAGRQAVAFSTPDGVQLQGAFYRAEQKNAAVVILLHALGEHSAQKPWADLAEELQKNGFSVLAFDFRGHGKSQAVDPERFWSEKVNQAMIKGAAKKPEEIGFSGMAQGYYPVLVNDIAAAKAFLDQRNDANDCNSASTIVVGAESSAVLGALWLESEHLRHRLDPNLDGMPPTPRRRAEGKDIIGAVWLTPISKLGNRTVSLTQLLDLPARRATTPMAFLFGDGDPAGRTLARNLEKTFKGKKKDLTAAIEVKDAGKRTGSALLQKDLGAIAAAVEFAKKVVDERSNAWEERDFPRASFVWRIGEKNIPAKLANEKTLVFDSYERFLSK